MLTKQTQYLRHMNTETMREECLALQRQQDAEQLLFRYLLDSACRSDTPLSITRSMGQYLGRELPVASGQLLTLPTTSNDPADQLMQIVAILGQMDIPTDDEENAPETREHTDGDRWISIVIPDLTLEERMRQLEEEKWRTPAGFGAKQQEKPSPLRPLRFLVLALFLLGGAYMLHTHGCAPIKKYLPQEILSLLGAEQPAPSPAPPVTPVPLTPHEPIQIWPEPQKAPLPATSNPVYRGNATVR